MNRFHAYRQILFTLLLLVGLCTLKMNGQSFQQPSYPDIPTDVTYNEQAGKWFLFFDDGFLSHLYTYDAGITPALQKRASVRSRPAGMFSTSSGSAYFLDRSRHIYSVINDTILPFDSIPIADSIISIGFRQGSPAFAIIRNDTTRSSYFVKKEESTWKEHPLLFTNKIPDATAWRVIFWFLFASLPLAAAALVAWNRKINREIRQEIMKQSVENPLLTKSEKPIGLRDEDLLGFNALEDAIISIIRNPQTELPMSIVISGDWGSGKSSMMNRIREKLETDPATNKRFMTSWFNAWHFQTENRLLDAFLLNIISSYNRNYQGFFEPFRLRLWLQRFKKQSPLKKIMFGFALAVALPFVLSIIKHISIIWFNITPFNLELLDTYENILHNLFIKESLFSSNSIPTFGAGIIAIVSALFLNRQLMPRGISSLITLLPKTSTRFEVEKRQTGYREEFKKEYWEIIDAGEGTKRLVVFIDDIDRISGEKVLELLEAINFISDVASKAPGTKSRAPNTIFVMGMYAKEVTKNLGTRLNEINKVEKADSNPQEAGARYIEKMVQLIVPIPFNGNQLKKLL